MDSIEVLATNRNHAVTQRHHRSMHAMPLPPGRHGDLDAQRNSPGALPPLRQPARSPPPSRHSPRPTTSPAPRQGRSSVLMAALAVPSGTPVPASPRRMSTQLPTRGKPRGSFYPTRAAPAAMPAQAPASLHHAAVPCFRPAMCFTLQPKPPTATAASHRSNISKRPFPEAWPPHRRISSHRCRCPAVTR